LDHRQSTREGFSASVGGYGIMMPMRRIFVGCCARAASCHAEAERDELAPLHC
jgi:hypothetical protein